jgi:hypothetical protein
MCHQGIRLSSPHHPKSSSHGPTPQERIPPPPAQDPVYAAWLASRVIPKRAETYLAPGTRRELSRTNARLAWTITQHCAWDLFKLLMGLHPVRTVLMLLLNIIRSLSPAFRGYWQALALNEVGIFLQLEAITSTNTIVASIFDCIRKLYLGLPLALGRHGITPENLRGLTGFIRVSQCLAKMVFVNLRGMTP